MKETAYSHKPLFTHNICDPAQAYGAMQVQDDIVAQLRMRDPLRLVSSMNRPNIHYSVYFTDLLENKEVSCKRCILCLECRVLGSECDSQTLRHPRGPHTSQGASDIPSL